jgi:tRNA(Ile)-lysidine synthase
VGQLAGKVLDRISAVARGGCRLRAGEPVLALVSGGGDSTLLLQALHELGHPVEALHVALALRGAASEQEAAACAAHAARLGVAFTRVDAPVEDGPNLESRAREARRAAALATAGSRAVATGHTADDRVETLLYRLATSRGRGALLVLPPRSGPFVRPLLGLRRDEIRSELVRAGIPFRDDASNLDRRFARNRIRLDLLPVLDGLHPAARGNLLATAEALAEEAEALDAAAAGLLDGDALDVPRAAAAPPALSRHALRLLAGPPSPPRAGLERALGLLASTAGSAWVPLDGERRAERRYDRLLVVPLAGLPVPRPRPLRAPGTTPFGTHQVRARLAGGAGLDATLADRLILRAARAGEHVAGRRRSVRRLLLEARIPATLRDGYPVVDLEGEVVCVPGLALAPAFLREHGLALTVEPRQP